MSITFTAAIDPALRVYRVTCEVLGELAVLPCEQAYALSANHKRECDNHLCEGYGADVEPADVPEVNCSQRNAFEILCALGYQRLDVAAMQRAAAGPAWLGSGEAFGLDMSGDATVAEFADRVTTALVAGPVDEGRPTLSVNNVHDLGRRPGYVQETLVALAVLADWCRQHDCDVTWY